MALQTGQSCQGRAFHFKVGDAVSLVLEAFDFLVLVRVGQGDAELTSLRTEEAAAGHGHAANHVGAGDAVHQFLVGMNHVGSRGAEVTCPAQVVKQSAFHGQVAHGVASFVKVQEAVESHRDFGTDEGAYGRVGLQAAAGTDAHDFQLSEGVVFFAGLEVDVGQRIDFIHHDVDVIAPDAGRGHHDAFAFVGTGDGTKLTAFHFTFAGVEVGGYEGHASGVTYQDNFVGQMLRFHVEMEYRTVFVDDQF